MKITRVVVILILYIVHIEGGLVQYSNVQDPDFPNKCLIEHTSLEDGESLSLDDTCMEITCYGGGYARGVTCGSVGVPIGCRLVTDDSKPYPDCCPQLVCDEKIELPVLNENNTALNDDYNDSNYDEEEEKLKQ